MVDQNATFQVEMGNSNNVIKGLSTIVEKLEVLNDTLMAVSLGDTFKATANSMRASSKAMNSTLDSVDKRLKRASSSAANYNRQLEVGAKTTKKMSNASRNSNRALMGGGSRSSFSMFGNKNDTDVSQIASDLKDLNDELKEAKKNRGDTVDIANRTVEEITSDIKELKKAFKKSSSVDEISKQIEKLSKDKEKFNALFSKSTDPLVRGEAQIRYEEASRKIDMLSESLTSQRDLMSSNIKGETSIEQLTKQIAELEGKQKELSSTFASSNDPIIRGEAQEKYRKAADELGELKDKLEEYQGLLRSDIQGRTGIDELVAQINELKKTQKDLSQQYASTDDPFLRGEAQEKYQKAGDKLERLNELLDEQKKLQSTNIAGKTNLQVFGEYAQEAATMINSTEAFMSTIGMSAEKFTAMTNVFDLGNGIITKTKVSYGDLLTVLSSGMERLSTTSSKAEGIASNLTNMASKFKGWSEQLSTASSGLQGLGNAADGIAGAASSSTGVMKVLGKVMGTTTAEAGSMAAGLAGSVATGLGAVGTALGFVSAAIGPIMIVLEAIKIGFELLNTLMGTTDENIQNNIEAIQTEVQKRQDLNDMIINGDIEALNKQRKALKKNINAKKEEIDALKEAQIRNSNLTDQFRTGVNQIFGNDYVFGATADKVRELEKELESFGSELDGLSSSTLDDAINRMADYNKMIEEGQEALSQLSEREDELNALRVNAVKDSSSHAEEIQKTEKDYADETANIAETRNSDELDRLKNHLKEMSSLTTEYDKVVVQATEDHLTELASEEESYLKEVANAVVEYNKEMATIAEDYRQSVIEEEQQWTEERQLDYTTHQKSLAKMDEDFNKAEIQRKKDLAQQLWEAELDNDALQYFKLQRQGDKDATEALESHNEEVDAEKQSYDEEQADKIKEREKARAEALAEAVKERADKIAQFEDERSQAKKDHLSSMDDLRKNFADSLAEQKANYENERALRSQQFQEKEASIKLDYLKEDQLRSDQQDKRRKELHDQYELELQYFADREALLTEYINAMKGTTKKHDSVMEAVTSGPMTSPETRKQLHDLLVAGFSDFGAEYSTKNAEEKMSYDEIFKLIDALEKNPNLNLDLSNWFDDPQLKGFSDALSEILDKGVTFTARNVKNYYDPIVGERTENVTQDTIDTLMATQTVSQLGGTGVLDLIDARLKGIENSFDYITVNDTVTTNTGYEESTRRKGEIEAMEGSDNVNQLRRDVNDLNTDVISANNEATLSIRKQQVNLLQTNSKHFGYMTEDTDLFYNDQLALLEQQNANALNTDAQGNLQLLSQDTTYMQNAGDVLGAGYDTMLTMGSDYNNDAYLKTDTANALALEQEAGYNSNIATLNSDANVVEMESEAAHNEEMLSQTDQYSSNLNNTVSSGYRNTVQSIVSESRSGTQAAASLYKVLNTEIVSSVARAIAQVRTMSASGTTSNGLTRTTARTSTGFGSLRGRTILAAKGAFIDRPTSLIAGEGSSPEVVFPFDESKGVPDDILDGIGKGLISGLAERQLYGNMGTNISPQSNSDAMIKVMMAAIGRLQGGMELNIQSVAVGSDISRTEIRQQFSNMQRAIIEAVASSIQGTLS